VVTVKPLKKKEEEEEEEEKSFEIYTEGIISRRHRRHRRRLHN